MPCRDPYRLYIRLAFTYLLRWSLKLSVKWSWTGSAFSTNMSAWSVLVTGSQSRVWSEPKLWRTRRCESRTNSKLQMDRLSLRNNGLKCKTSRTLPIDLEEFIKHSWIQLPTTEICNMQPVDCGNNRISTDNAQRISRTLIWIVWLKEGIYYLVAHLNHWCDKLVGGASLEALLVGPSSLFF
jgi:hypothetical protein